MPYEPTNWKSGDVVTSAKLNKLEEAVADAEDGALNLTLANSIQNPFSGSVTGATAEEIESAWTNKTIHATIAVGDSQLTVKITNKWSHTSYTSYSGCAVVYYNTAYILIYTNIYTESMTFSSTVFTLSELSG